MRLAVSATLISLISVMPIASFAQPTPAPPQDILQAPSPMPSGTVSCFDYYAFGSVQAKLITPVASTVSGATLTFSGTLENANPYPVIDGALFVKVFKKRGTRNDGNGPDVVDQFFVKDAIAIPANASVPVSFQWRVPAYAQSGDYELATFFTTSHKFNLLGLSFTDDVVGNTVPFKVIGEQASGVSFDKAGVTINGTPYRFAAYPPRVGSDPATLQATVRNTTDTNQSATVAWTVYQWDAQRAANVVQEQQTTVTVPPDSSVPVSITVRDANHPVYLAVGTLSWRDTKSIIGARFVREGIDQPRINFPSITAFPLKVGTEAALFSCLHNTSENTTPDGRLELSLTDRFGRTIAEHSYSGAITSAMMGVAESFTPSKDYDYAILDAKLYKGSALVDEASVVYDCAVIDPTECTPPSLLEALLGSVSALASAIVLIILAVGAIAFGAWFRRRRSASPPPGEASTL